MTSVQQQIISNPAHSHGLYYLPQAVERMAKRMAEYQRDPETDCAEPTPECSCPPCWANHVYELLPTDTRHAKDLAEELVDNLDFFEQERQREKERSDRVFHRVPVKMTTEDVLQALRDGRLTPDDVYPVTLYV